MMNVIEIYDQFTTTWEQIRANILSHAIAAGLLWFVGFAPSLPDIGLADLAAVQAHPIYPMIKGVGFLALVSFGLALAIGVYAIVLREVGRILLSAVMIFIPPALSLSRSRKFVPRDALFNIAATLEGGTHQARDLESRMFELLATYSVSRPEETQSLLIGHEEMQHDANTHLRNAAVFVLAWISAPWIFAEGSAFVLSIEASFWSGLLVLMCYLLIARARLLFGLQFATVWSAKAVATLVQRDELFADRLTTARLNPEPYWRLVDLYLGEERDDSNPSLLDYLKSRVGKQAADADPDSIERPGRLQTAFRDLRRFGWDEEVNRDYEDRVWLLRYAGWRTVRILNALWNLAKYVLAVLGLRRL